MIGLGGIAGIAGTPILASPSPKQIGTAAHQLSNTATSAAAGALAGVFDPLLRDLKYGAVWVGLMLLGIVLIFEGLTRTGTKAPAVVPV